MRGLVVAFFILNLISAATARADVLFLDLNNAPSEVAAARRAVEERNKRFIEAAQERGEVIQPNDSRLERLHVIPRVSPTEQAMLIKSRNETLRAENRVRIFCRDSTTSSGCTSATANLAAAKKTHVKNYNSVARLDKKKLNEEFKKLKDAKVSLSSVVISAHDGDREFWGELTKQLDDSDIEEAFLKNKPLADNVRSVLLWACYGATTDDFITGWKKAFPATVMIGGFSGQAPLDSRPASPWILEDLLIRQEQFAQTRDRDELNRLFKELRQVNGTTAAICIDRDLIVTKKGVRTVEDDILACGNRSKEEEKHLQVYYCHLRADPGCEDVPKEAQSKAPLRRAYDFLQETRHCEDVLEKQGKTRPVSQLSARSLLFDQIVRMNFEKHHKSELAGMNKLLDQLGFPPELRYKDLDKMTRKQYLDNLRGIEQEWLRRMNDAKDAEGLVYDAKLLAAGKYIGEVQKVEKAGCVPLSWVEEDEALKDSSCGIKQGMRTAIKSAEADVNRLLTRRAAELSERSAASSGPARVQTQSEEVVRQPVRKQAPPRPPTNSQPKKKDEDSFRPFWEDL